MRQDNPLGRYTILRELGRGATGTVYAVRDRSTGANVALKTLDRALFDSLAERFLRQARSARRLSHPNIVRILDAGEADGTAYVAMELPEGESLRRILDEGPLPVARAVQIARDIASALAYAHLEGVVHAGIKPSNIIVLRSGVAKITDFGTARLGETAGLSGAGAGLSYLSPEQLRGHPADHRSDLFSLGALLYEMLTRRPPFEGHSAKEVLENIVHTRPPPPSERNPHVPRALDAIVAGMLAAQPDERVPGAPILLRDLQGLEEGLGVGTQEGFRFSPPQDQPGDESRLDVHLDASAAERFPPRSPYGGEAFYERDTGFMMPREPQPERSSGSRAALLAALALVLALLSIGLTVFLDYSPGFMERLIPASRMRDAPQTAAVPPPSRAPAPVTEAIKEPAPLPPKPLVAEPGPSTQIGGSSAGEPEQPAPPAEPAPLPRKAPQARQPTGDIRQPQLRGTAKLTIAVSPQGELYIDGAHRGTTPPTTTVDLEPGMHRIEIRRGSRKPYVTYMTVQAGDERRIRHDFDAPPLSRPPP